MWPSATLACALAFAGCSGGDEPLECNPNATPSCAPLYPPTFDNIYTMTLTPKCGTGGASCHSNAGNKGGMSLAGIDNAYAELLEAGQDRVIPGDPACSEMIIRVTSTDFSILMPRGSPMAAAEQCALIQWVANGAPR